MCSLLVSPQTSPAAMTFTAFAHNVQQEVIHGSAIAAPLYESGIQLVADTVIDAGGDVQYPIHEALNWRITRFGRQARQTQYAALFVNENQSCWQAKLHQPLWDQSKQKARKYETPVGAGSRAYLPAVPAAIRQRIADRYEIAVPEAGSFWEWVRHANVPIILTEGAKKALSLMSQGYIAIALYGVNGGYRSQDALGNPCTPYLIKDLVPLIQPDRPIYLAFDQDAAVQTRQKVNLALARFSKLLTQAKATVRIVQWDGAIGKGADDLIVNGGVDRFEQAYDQAPTVEEWRVLLHLTGQLTLRPTKLVEAPDLSQVELVALPESGIIGIASPKGTGKTKCIAGLLKPEDTVALATHRVCLGRNLCSRVGIHWRGDLDKFKGQFIAGDGYTLQVGFCVDSLLAIDPDRFTGCVLIIDEVVQVLRHLLTSSTCRKDGKLPALLARLRQLVQVAKRVIVADADLDDATLHYLADLRDDRQPVYLIRNDIQSAGYAVEFIQAPNATAAIAKFVEVVQSGDRVFVSTDSKAGSKRLAKLLDQLSIKYLLLNSETSGGPDEQAFITNPDRVLATADYPVVIATPSLSTGASIESNYFDQVFGLFYGASSTDADMAQGLGRVRQPVPRVVWCAEQGMNLSKVSNSTNPMELRTALKHRTDATTTLLRCQLREDVQMALETYDWQGDPHLRLWSQIAAKTNFAMLNLRVALRVRLRQEGNRVTVWDLATHPLMKETLKQLRQDIQTAEAQAIANAQILTPTERRALEGQEAISPEDQLNLEKTAIAEFYRLEEAEITAELILHDRQGKTRREFVAFESLVIQSLAESRDLKNLEQQVGWNQGLCPWTLGLDTVRAKALQRLGITEFLDPEKCWTKYDTQQVADRARAAKTQMKELLNYTVSDKVSDTQIVHDLLDRLGVKVKHIHWSNKVAGHEGEKLRVYQLDPGCWQFLLELLQRRHPALAVGFDLRGSPLVLNISENTGGDPQPPSQIPEIVDLRHVASPPEDDRWEAVEWFDQAV
jgi:Domain of unknown function (DUF3854)/Origin of replication binding protein